MKVLLLGTSGLLGQNVLLHLASEGHEVHAQLRRATPHPLPVEPAKRCIFDPLDETDLQNAAQGCDAIVNCIGATDMSLRQLSDFLPANRDLPKVIVRAMEKTGVKRLVHTSSSNTIGYGTSTNPADERCVMQSPFSESLYAKSKRMGEEVVLRAAMAHPDWHVVVLCPGFMLGAWDSKPSSGRMLLSALRKPVMFAPDGGKAFVSVTDVAQAAVRSLTAGSGRYLIVGENMTISDLFQLQARLLGYRQRIIILPRWLLAMAGTVGDILRTLGLRTELSSNNIKQLLVHEYYDGTRALTELGITATPIETAIKQFHQWREKNHY